WEYGWISRPDPLRLIALASVYGKSALEALQALELARPFTPSGRDRRSPLRPVKEPSNTSLRGLKSRSGLTSPSPDDTSRQLCKRNDGTNVAIRDDQTLVDGGPGSLQQIRAALDKFLNTLSPEVLRRVATLCSDAAAEREAATRPIPGTGSDTA